MTDHTPTPLRLRNRGDLRDEPQTMVALLDSAADEIERLSSCLAKAETDAHIEMRNFRSKLLDLSAVMQEPEASQLLHLLYPNDQAESTAAPTNPVEPLTVPCSQPQCVEDRRMREVWADQATRNADAMGKLRARGDAFLGLLYEAKAEANKRVSHFALPVEFVGRIEVAIKAHPPVVSRVENKHE